MLFLSRNLGEDSCYSYQAKVKSIPSPRPKTGSLFNFCNDESLLSNYCLLAVRAIETGRHIIFEVTKTDVKIVEGMKDCFW